MGNGLATFGSWGEEALNATGGDRTPGMTRLIGLLAGGAGLLLTGCTMCPDLYDYSGPVPNGSATQNDFRARSNGIAQIGNSPRPWPPLVKQDHPARDQAILVAGEDPAPELTR